MTIEIRKWTKDSNKSLIVFLSMVVILVSILLFAAFLASNFKMFLYEQRKISAYAENLSLLSDVSLNLKKIEQSLMESKLTLSNLTEFGYKQESFKNYFNSKMNLDSDILKIYMSSNKDSTQSSWFVNAKKAKGKISFSLPYLDTQSKKVLVDFSTNIYNSKGQDIGVVVHSFYLEKLTRVLQQHKKIPEHEIYLLDYSENLITSASQNDMKNMQSFKFDKIGLNDYKDKIFSYSNLFIADDDYYIFFTPVFDRNFVLISKMPVKSIYSTKNFFSKKRFVIPTFIFITIIIFVSIFVIMLMSIEQRKKEKIEKDSLTDSLTKIYNRRYYEKVIESEFTRMEREEKPISLIMLDIDFFKVCNDTYGHSQGDEVLKCVAEIFVKHARREHDVVFRLGGEEFGVLLVGTGEENAFEIADKIRMEVQETKIPLKDSKGHISVTISAGIASLVPRIEQNPKILYDIADEMLYRAKRTGRNKVCS
ncbi:MAG: sensor domain-containing diguanylate cyclase [Fibromonadaceae bacterium]|jgi:diguanylate cyclase (GGDEF)-like protein|nr:sensor domain-containing diguanylate cyclase [Fibromonadaceae bacterium]